MIGKMRDNLVRLHANVAIREDQITPIETTIIEILVDNMIRLKESRHLIETISIIATLRTQDLSVPVHLIQDLNPHTRIRIHRIIPRFQPSTMNIISSFAISRRDLANTADPCIGIVTALVYSKI